MVSVDRIKGLSSGLAIKAPCRVATTTNIPLSGLFVVDTEMLTSGDAVLVKNQTNSVDNGVWVASTSSWSRRSDADKSNDLVNGTLFTVAEGVQSGQIFQLVAIDPVVPGATALVIEPKVPLGLDTSAGAGLIGATDGAGGTLWTTVQGFIAKILSSAGASIVGFIQSGTGSVPRTMQDKARERKTVLDFGADPTGAEDSLAAFSDAAVEFPEGVIVPEGSYTLSADISASAVWVIEPGAVISTRNFPAAPGSGGGYKSFNKSRLVDGELIGQELSETLAYGPGKNLFNNPYFSIWQRLDVLGGASVVAPSPTYGVSSTYSGFGGLRTFGPDCWWGKIWGGAYNPADPVTNPGGGNLLLERKSYGSSGVDIDAPHYLRATFTGYNSNVGFYDDPIHGSGTDIGTNSVEIGTVIRGARRYGKMTFKLRARWLSGDNTIMARYTYDFGTGGSENTTINLQGITLNTDGEAHDYYVNFEVPDMEQDGEGNTIVFGTSGTDYITFSLTSGDGGNFSYDIFAIGLYRGWGFMPWERYDQPADLLRCRSEFQYSKIAYAGTTVSGANHGGVVAYNPPMVATPTITFPKFNYNSGAFTLAPQSYTVDSSGWGYTTAPAINVGASWVASTAYAVGDMVNVAGTGRIYNCTIAGTSSGAAPSHTTGTAADGTVTWQYCGTVTATVTAFSAWAATTAYSVGAIRTANGNDYSCVVAGISSSTAPSHSSGIATDGTVTWLYLSAAANKIATVTMTTWTGTAGKSGYLTPPTITITGGGGIGGAVSPVMYSSAFGGDKYGIQWWLPSGSSANNGRVIGLLESNAQLVKL